MKKWLICLFILILITCGLLVYENKKMDNNQVEININSFQYPQNMRKLINKMGVYDYVNVYDLLVNNKIIKVYEGNINILLNKYEIEDENITLGNDEVIVGDKFLDGYFNNFYINNKVQFNNKDYLIGCTLKNTEDIYFKNLDLLYNNIIVKQVVYVSKFGRDNYVSLDRMKTILDYNYVSVLNMVDYEDVSDTLKLILCFFNVLFIVLVFVKLYKYTRTKFEHINKNYHKTNRVLTILEFIKDKSNMLLICRFMSCVLCLIIMCYICFYLLNYIFSVRVPYSINITSVKNLDLIINQSIEFFRYSFKFGFTDRGLCILNIVLTYIITIIILISSCIIHKVLQYKLIFKVPFYLILNINLDLYRIFSIMF